MVDATGIAGAQEYKPAHKGQHCYTCNHEFGENGGSIAACLSGVGVIQFCLKPECYESFQNDMTDELAQLQFLFSLRWKADMRAIKMWQAAGPDREMTWPDHADLVVWLLEQLDAQR